MCQSGHTWDHYQLTSASTCLDETPVHVPHVLLYQWPLPDQPVHQSSWIWKSTMHIWNLLRSKTTVRATGASVFLWVQATHRSACASLLELIPVQQAHQSVQIWDHPLIRICFCVYNHYQISLCITRSQELWPFPILIRDHFQICPLLDLRPLSDQAN